MSKFKQLQATAKELGINSFGKTAEALQAEIEKVSKNDVKTALEGETLTTPEGIVIEEVKTEETKRKPGRPIVEGSERQKRLAEQEQKRANGELKRGRPVIEGSKRQQDLAAKEARKEANGGEVKRGRPVDPNSAAYKKKMEREAKIKAGIVLKPGRPKMIKVDVEKTEGVETVKTTETVPVETIGE